MVHGRHIGKIVRFTNQDGADFCDGFGDFDAIGNIIEGDLRLYKGVKVLITGIQVDLYEGEIVDMGDCGETGLCVTQWVFMPEWLALGGIRRK